MPQKVQENKEGLELNGSQKDLFSDNDISIMGINIMAASPL
jgi:hypothetical protein